MEFNNAISLIDDASDLLEQAHNIIKDSSTLNDAEDIIKQNFLTRLTNLLTECVIISDIMEDLENNPGDETAIETVLELLSGTEDILS